MAHYVLTYAACGLWTAIVIATTDLLTPKKPQMGTGYTIVFGVLWPFFVTVVMIHVLRTSRR